MLNFLRSLIAEIAPSHAKDVKPRRKPARRADKVPPKPREPQTFGRRGRTPARSDGPRRR